MELSNIAKLPTKYGTFNSISVKAANGADHLIVFKGDLYTEDAIPIRIHSECLTGDAFGSLKCDCGEQLDYSLDYISKQTHGMIVYLRQEGRGIGLFNKINAYNLQDKGLDTVEANVALGFEPDLREFSLVAIILKELGVKKINLLTNNPDKEKDLINAGIKIEKCIPLRITPNVHNENYLKTKKTFFKHTV